MNVKEFLSSMSNNPAVASLGWSERDALQRAASSIGGWTGFDQDEASAARVLAAIALVESFGVRVESVVVSRVSWGGYPFATLPRETLAARLIAWAPDGANVHVFAGPPTDTSVHPDAPWRDLP